MSRRLPLDIARAGSARVLAAALVFAAVLPFALDRRGAPAAAPSHGAPAAEESLVVLHTNDIHARLTPFATRGGRLRGGAAARAWRLEREGSGDALLLDAGDVFQGTAFFNLFRGAPDYESMSRMGYDAGALGNHDLDLGPTPWLLAAREHARFPILSANVFVAAESAWAKGLPETPEPLRPGARWVGGGRVPRGAGLRYLATPYVIGSWGGRRVGILGLTTGDLVRIVSIRSNAGVAVSDPITVAARIVPELRRSADVVIALTHLGLEEDRALAARVPGIDLIVGGHSHTLLERPVIVRGGAVASGGRGTAIVQAGEWGAHVGRAVIRFTEGTIRAVDGRVVPVDPAEGEEAGIKAWLRVFEDSVSAVTARPVFESRGEVPRAGLRQGETPLGNFVADAMREAAGADIAIQNAGGIRADLPRGPVTVGDLYAVLPFDNRLVVVPMEGWRVRQLLDFIANRLGNGGFAQVSGVSFAISGGRALAIRVAGEPLDGAKTYRVVTNSYLYEGGDGYTAFAKAAPAEDTGILTRDAAVAFLQRHPDYVFKKEGRIRWEGALKLPFAPRRR